LMHGLAAASKSSRSCRTAFTPTPDAESLVRDAALTVRQRAAGLREHLGQQLGEIVELRFFFERRLDVSADARRFASTLAQRAREKRQASIHSVVNAGVRIVELLVAMRDAMLGQPQRELTRAVVDLVLIAPTAVDEDASQRT
jgi:hypothetical protein